MIIYTYQGQQRSREEGMTLDKFIEENIDEIEDHIAYLEDKTTEEIHNKQLDLKAEYETEIVDLMKDLYEKYLLKED